MKDDRLEPVETFEGLMPYPKKKPKKEEKPEEPTEAPVRALEAYSRASSVKDISTGAEVVETDSGGKIKARKNTHQAMLRR